MDQGRAKRAQAERNGAPVEARLEAERSVLGAILLAPECLSRVAAELEAKAFYREPHRIIFSAMLRVQERRGSLDLMLLTEDLRDAGELRKAGGVEYLAKLAQSVPVAANLPAHVRMVRDAHRRRAIEDRLGAAILQIQDRDRDPFEAVTELATDAAALGRSGILESCDDYGRDAVALAERYLAEEADLGPPVPSGFHDLDQQTGGMRRGAYIALAGRSEGGKSMMALTMARNAAQAGHPVAFLALEMPSNETFARNASALSGVDSRRIIDRTLSREEAERVYVAASEMRGWPLRTWDSIRSLEGICTLARALASAGELALLVIDHVHLVTAAGNGYERSFDTSGALRRLAVELRIAVLAVCQYRQGFDKTGERPQRDWIKGGTHMFQDPTDIWLLHRPDPESDRVDLIIDKGRHLERPRTVPLVMLGKQSRFASYSNR